MRLRRLLRLALPLLSLAAPAALAQYSEAEVKAAFVFNVIKFAEWPAEALPAGAPLRLCVAGAREPLAEALMVFDGKTVQGRPLEVRRGGSFAALRPCHVVVLGAAAEARQLPTGERNLLTVGDYDGFIDDGGMIGMAVADNRVQFEANAESAKRGGVRLPAQLLRLARRVKGQ